MMRSVEATTQGRRITWFTILGLVLVPLAIGGVLLWGLWNPTDRLDQVTAAVVNEDEGVELDGQVVPLGRQLAAGLVDPDVASAAGQTNYTWILTDADDAADGQRSGDYAVVVTIPADFSAAATSYSGDPAAAVQATIDVQTSEHSRLVDDVISGTIVQAATDVLNSTLTTTYIENVFLGFSTLSDQLGDAASGASGLATGAVQLSDGTSQLASGVASLADGVGQLSTGASDAAAGAAQLRAGAETFAAGSTDFAGRLGQLATGTATAGGSAAAASVDTAAVLASMQGYSIAQQQALAICQTDAAECASAVQRASAALPTENALASLAENVAATDIALNGGSSLAPQLAPQDGLVAGAAAAAAGAWELASGADEVSDGVASLATGLDALAGGVSATAAGARELADGTTALVDGSSRLTSGTQELADGLDTAVQEIPGYTDRERQNLAEVVAEPVLSSAPGGEIFGQSGVALLAAVALWLGALVTYLVVRPVSSRVLGSTRSALRLALSSYLPGLAVGVVQGAALGTLMLTVLELDATRWGAFLGFAALAGATFAALNQGLAGLLGGLGRFVSMLVAVIGVVGGLLSAVPTLFGSLFGALPLGGAFAGLQAIIDGSNASAAWTSVVGLMLWLLLGLALSVLAAARRRTVRPAALGRERLSAA